MQRKWDVRGAGLDSTSDARPSYLNLELHEECSRTLGMGWNRPEQLGVQADAIGEKQLKRTQSGSNSRSGRNRGTAAEVDVSGERRAAAGADAIGEQQLKRIDAIGELAVEADAIREQQLCTENCPPPDFSRK